MGCVPPTGTVLAWAGLSMRGRGVVKQDLVFKRTMCDDRTYRRARCDLSYKRQPVVPGGRGTGGRNEATARGEHYGGF